jgi:dTDP-glucose 4,6-dehydratase
MNIFVTGGSGFIGSALVRFLIRETSHNIFNIDKLTYAADPRSLDSIERNQRYTFIKEDIINNEKILDLLMKHQPTLVFHLAAESHVDNSINDPLTFVETNVTGTASMLQASLAYWQSLSKHKKDHFRFHHISTDEVYGDLGRDGFFVEDTPYNPSSPYSASKASSDHLVRAWNRTYKLPTLITNCSNNYGPFQFPEKLIPLVITNVLGGKKIPVYGDGMQVRDWLHVDDHVEALFRVISIGKIGETYNIGGNNEMSNIEVVKLICDFIDQKRDSHNGQPSHQLIEYVQDRPGHDSRYAIDARKIKRELGWEPRRSFEQGLSETIDWYLGNY